ncbi:putative transferase [Rosa chinensis]|uniref:Putative transferase n=1 Tax=Rosa chinensis TaxID=74649 RepID=A0A2P6P3K1_ROSCH|nr:putative transferase [Rosa chinensis]
MRVSFISSKGKHARSPRMPITFSLEELVDVTRNFDSLFGLRSYGKIVSLIGVAKAVHFLHTGIIPGFLSNQLKMNNILLNEHDNAKLSDYGLSIVSEETDMSMANEGRKSW